ncbi:apolipoprotein N-acyltransferase [Sulfitobacter sp. S0837]|uniref:apolipoprotein N-acyltransferase n=1 Tax=Sulfitobacter maritimus TaxID=2741719 RepID=UPI0015840CBF|nr:apolipoprotein N-acyltransferase [Sulfitobacter maritimus]NUH67208.1 apolipoprotein N-acyltransferase [Sulfitobacter maritimus]
MIQGLARRGRFLLAPLAGAIAAVGQAPYDLPLLLFAGLIAAFWLYRAQSGRPWRAALLGWGFGFGYFLHALQWIVSPFMVDVARHGWMAPFALILLAAGIALFWGLAFGAARWLAPRRVWVLAVTWAAVELLRAYIFTGFPWAMPAQALVGVMAGQGMAWVGPYALNLWLFFTAALLVMRGALTVRLGQGALALSMALLLVLPPQAPPAPLTDNVVRLVQPNAAQRDKWNPDTFEFYFKRQLDYTAAAPQSAGAAPDLVIWPETAIPWALDMAGSALAEIGAASEVPVVLGVQRRQNMRYYNSLVVLDANGAVDQLYDKHHLVPFGEYMPMGDLMARFGIHGLAAQEGNGYSSGPGAQLVDLGALGTGLPLICYEAVFAHDVNAAPERPSFLMQVTNDAWFGKAAGPKQHLAQARMRAIEQGLPMARAANTGISAMIDPWGRVTASLALNTEGFVDAPLPKPLPPTLYSRSGDLPLALLFALLLAGLVMRRRRAGNAD